MLNSNPLVPSFSSAISIFHSRSAPVGLSALTFSLQSQTRLGRPEQQALPSTEWVHSMSCGAQVDSPWPNWLVHGRWTGTSALQQAAAVDEVGDGSEPPSNMHGLDWKMSTPPGFQLLCQVLGRVHKIGKRPRPWSVTLYSRNSALS